jgi:glutamate dehydrogenase
MESTAARDLDAAARFIRELERQGTLDRAVEMLPDDQALKALAREGRGLTRPELSVLLAYAKLDLFDSVVKSTLPDDPYFARWLAEYFPKLAVERFAPELPRHRLAREIIATELVNRAVNLAGPLYAHRMRELSNAPAWTTVRAFALADGAFGLSNLAKRIGGLDLKVPAKTQIAIMSDIAELLRRLGLWFIVQLPPDSGVGKTVETYRAGVAALKGRFSGLVSPLEAKATEARIGEFQKAGMPLDIAQDAGILPLLSATPEIVLLSQTSRIPVDAAAGAYFAMGGVVGLDRLRALAGQIISADHWDRLALRRIVDDLYAAQRLLTGGALTQLQKSAQRPAAAEAAQSVRGWAKAREQDLERTAKFLAELACSGEPTIAKLSLANSQIQKLAALASA